MPFQKWGFTAAIKAHAGSGNLRLVFWPGNCSHLAAASSARQNQALSSTRVSMLSPQSPQSQSPAAVYDQALRVPLPQGEIIPDVG